MGMVPLVSLGASWIWLLLLGSPLVLSKGLWCEVRGPASFDCMQVSGFSSTFGPTLFFPTGTFSAPCHLLRDPLQQFC